MRTFSKFKILVLTSILIGSKTILANDLQNSVKQSNEISDNFNISNSSDELNALHSFSSLETYKDYSLDIKSYNNSSKGIFSSLKKITNLSYKFNSNQNTIRLNSIVKKIRINQEFYEYYGINELFQLSKYGHIINFYCDGKAQNNIWGLSLNLNYSMMVKSLIINTGLNVMIHNNNREPFILFTISLNF